MKKIVISCLICVAMQGMASVAVADTAPLRIFGLILGVTQPGDLSSWKTKTCKLEKTDAYKNRIEYRTKGCIGLKDERQSYLRFEQGRLVQIDTTLLGQTPEDITNLYKVLKQKFGIAWKTKREKHVVRSAIWKTEDYEIKYYIPSFYNDLNFQITLNDGIVTKYGSVIGERWYTREYKPDAGVANIFE